jgi:hypothetical protein
MYLHRNPQVEIAITKKCINKLCLTFIGISLYLLIQYLMKPDYDKQFISYSNNSFPICRNLNRLNNILIKEEEFKYKTELEYTKLMSKKKLNCGRIRVTGLLSKGYMYLSIYYLFNYLFIYQLSIYMFFFFIYN